MASSPSKLAGRPNDNRKPSSLTRQPFKFLFTIFTLTTLPLRIIFILLFYVPHYLRQHSQWTYHQAVGKEIFSLWWKYTTAIRYRTSKSLNPGSGKERFVIIPPASESPSIYQGILNSPIVRPKTIGGVWFPRPYVNTIEPTRVAIHFHGGAFVLGGCRQMESGWGPEVLARHIKGSVLQPQYRLASEDGCHFPAAVQDGLTAYFYVLNTLGVNPEQVIFSGESAGGNLVLAMLRYLHRDGKGVMPLPRAALLWSPWLNLTAGKDDIDGHANAKTDYVTGDLLKWGVELYTPPGWDSGNPYLSPLGNEFESQVPIFLQTGTAEVLYDDHVRFAKGMKRKGTKLELQEIKSAPHDTFGAGIILGFAKEAEDAADKSAVFAEKVHGK